VYLRTSPDFTGQDNRKCGVVDKSEALAPMYPQFVMRKSDLRSSFKSGVRLKESLPKDVDISGKGADDHIGLCVSIGLGVPE